MKKFKNKIFNLLIINALFVFNCLSQIAINKCASGEYEKQKCLLNKNYATKRAIFNNKLNQLVEQSKKSNARVSNINTLIRIPVVIHVIHNNQAGVIGGKNNPNISNEQIISQIEVLNELFISQ